MNCDTISPEMEQLFSEKLYPLPEAYKRATGSRPVPSVPYRHWKKGIGGIRLETVKCAGKRETSVEAVRRFFAATTAAAGGETPAPQTRTSRQREAGYSEAERYLAGEGID